MRDPYWGSPVDAHNRWTLVPALALHVGIRALAEEKELKVFAFVEDAAASGGYMIACAADEIVADPASIVGSIGVVSAGFGFDRLIERIGIDRRVHTQGEAKAMLDNALMAQTKAVQNGHVVYLDPHAAYIAFGGYTALNKLLDQLAQALSTQS